MQISAPRHREEPFQSNFRALCKGNRIVDIHTQIANGVLDVRVAQQYLDSPEVACRLVNQRGLRSAHRVRPVFMHVKADCPDPLVNQPCILARAEMTHIINTDWKDEILKLTSPTI